MGLFSSNKNPCVICGGATPRFLATKIENQPICSACDTRIDVQPDFKDSITISELKEHFQFLEQNQLLKDRFCISQKVDFGFFSEKFIFDFENHYFCMSNKPDKIVFEGNQVTSFTIKEDHSLLFEGLKSGLKRYNSTVPERINAMMPQIAMAAIAKQMQRANDHDNDHREYRPTMDLPEPFREFHIVIQLDHPYWREIALEVNGPTFDNTYPDANDYLNKYQSDVETMEELALALTKVCFPQAQGVTMGGTVPAYHAGQANPVSTADPIEEIRKYKELMEQGIISEAEFAAKKRQLLGI